MIDLGRVGLEDSAALASWRSNHGSVMPATPSPPTRTNSRRLGRPILSTVDSSRTAGEKAGGHWRVLSRVTDDGPRVKYAVRERPHPPPECIRFRRYSGPRTVRAIATPGRLPRSGMSRG